MKKLNNAFFEDINVFLKKQAEVISLLVEYGNSDQDAVEMMNEKFNYVYKTYPNASNEKMAEIVSSLNAF